MKYRVPRLARLRLILAAIVIGLFAVGCGSTVEGDPERASGQEGLFNPCTDIPDSVIEEVGLDPSTENIDISGVEQPGWKICSWAASWYYVIVYSNKYSIVDARANADFAGFTSMRIGTRDVVQFRRTEDVEVERCYAAIDVDQGSIWIAVDLKGGEEQRDPICELDIQYVQKLETYLPR
ncbi:DUF3558 domain-containing protein [Rhodococcus globerulus]|uniref:DUF3558 domain-containing protein n=1 Tax=Rhodococcus globerulus TaxID=33008 RepID=UPI000B1166D3|nr:DUF3558 domain-containing protein [Rhodococcus globerulus]